MSKTDPDAAYVPNPAYTRDDWNEVSDNPEWTEADFRNARPFAEVLPELADALRRGRDPRKAPVKQLVSLRLDRDVLERFRASGPGWQSRMNAILRRAASEL